MKKQNIRQTFGKIRPDEDLIRRTKTAMQMSRGAKILDPPIYARHRWRNIATACAAMLILTFGIFTVYGNMGRDFTGSFTQTDDFSELAAVSRHASLSAGDSESSQYVAPHLSADSFIGSFSGSGHAVLVTDATVKSLAVYEANSDEYGVYGFALLTLRINTVVDSETEFHTFRRDDTITALIYLESSSDTSELPQENTSGRFYLYSGENGNPDDERSLEIGFFSVWNMYEYVPEK